MAYVLSKTEFDIAQNAIENILTQTVESIELTDAIPPINDIPDSNKVFKGKLSVLFVDMRKSTDLTDELKSKKMVKVYRAFIRSIIQAIRYTGGYSRQFVGDGIMGVFQDSVENDIKTTSSQKALNASRYILTLIDYCLNSKLKRHMDGLGIACGVGICTGTIMVTKVGMRGKESDETAENELGIVWTGSTTNYASRLCSLAVPREIFIDERTFKDIEIEQDIWKKVERQKGTKSFEGYVSKEYYLELPDGIDAELVISEADNQGNVSVIEQIFQETKSEALTLIDDISKKSAELAIALENVKKREEQVKGRENQSNQNEARLSQWQQRLNEKQEETDEIYEQNKIDKYEIHKKIFELVHCKKAFAVGMEKSFWTTQLEILINCGASIGKNPTIVKSEICHALVGLYQNLDMYAEAYQALCIQAEYHSWIHDFTVEEIVRKYGAYSQLKGVIEKRLTTLLTASTRDYLEKCLSKLKSMGY